MKGTNYDTKITFEFPSGSVIVNGVEKTNYVSGASVFAAFDVRPPKGRLIFVAETDQSVTSRWIKVRYISSITSKWRVKRGNEVYCIVSSPLDEGLRHKELYIELEVVE